MPPASDHPLFEPLFDVAVAVSGVLAETVGGGSGFVGSPLVDGLTGTWRYSESSSLVSMGSRFRGVRLLSMPLVCAGRFPIVTVDSGRLRKTRVDSNNRP